MMTWVDRSGIAWLWGLLPPVSPENRLQRCRDLTEGCPGAQCLPDRIEEVLLTALEFRLLLDLARRAGRVQSRDALLERVWGYSPNVETRTVDTHVKRLREKLGPAGKYIETLRGVGYRFAASPDGGES